MKKMPEKENNRADVFKRYTTVHKREIRLWFLKIYGKKIAQQQK